MNSKDIAKLAGVSRSTVSRVINNYSNVPEETREKVMKIIEEYNYVPNISGRMLVGKHNKIIGLIIIDKKDTQKKLQSSTYFSTFTTMVIDNAMKFGYNVLVTMVNNNADYKNVKEVFYNKTIAGGIFIGGMDDDEDILEIASKGHECVVIGQNFDNMNFNDCILINPDNYLGAHEAVTELINLGHRDVLIITGDMEQFSGRERLRGFYSAVNDNRGLEIKLNIAYGNFTEQSGYTSVYNYITSKKQIPDAILASNDHMAIGAITALNELNIKVPEDVSIIGFDDIEVAKYITPTLSSVKISLDEMADIAVSKLIEKVKGNTEEGIKIVVPTKLCLRNSTALHKADTNKK